MEDVMFELADRFKELKDKKKQKEWAKTHSN